MYLGRFTLGEEVTIPLLARAADGSAASADSPPAVAVLDGAGAVLVSTVMLLWDKARSPGLYVCRLRLASGYTPGRYLVRAGYAKGGAPRLCGMSFDVVAGGDGAGPVLSMYHLERPHANYLVQKLDSGARAMKRSPYL